MNRLSPFTLIVTYYYPADMVATAFRSQLSVY